uniref:hypothetical protein n=1 Tax=Enterococcus avium TaxID=33945 RepID=UPI003FA4A883
MIIHDWLRQDQRKRANQNQRQDRHEGCGDHLQIKIARQLRRQRCKQLFQDIGELL